MQISDFHHPFISSRLIKMRLLLLLLLIVRSSMTMNHEVRSFSLAVIKESERRQTIEVNSGSSPTRVLESAE